MAKKTGYGIYVIAAIVLVVAVVIMLYSSGTFGQAVKLGNYVVQVTCYFDYPPGTTDAQMKINTCKDNRWGHSCSGFESCSFSFKEKYGQNFHVSSSCGGSGHDVRVDGRGRELHFNCASVMKVLPAVPLAEPETYARSPEPTPAPTYERAVMPSNSVPQIISSVLSYTSQGGQKAPYTLAGKDYVVELYYAKPGEPVKIVVNGEGLHANPGSPTVTKDGTIIFVTGVELKSVDRSDVQFLMLSPTTSAPCKECPACPTPTHIVMDNQRETWVVKDPYGVQKQYDVEVLVVDSVNKQAKFKINGEITDAIPIGGTDILSDGSMLVVADIRNVQVEAAILPVPLNWKYASAAR